MIPLILELDEPLKDGEEMIGIKSIILERERGYSKIGYVAIIINRHSKQSNDLRYGSLKGVQYHKRKFQKLI